MIRLPELSLRPVVGTDWGQDVRWVAVSELPDPAAYLEGGELLLTTGVIAQDWASCTARIAAADVAGLGFGVGLSHAEVPSELVAAATEVRLPLVEVPEATPFLAISKAVAQLVADEERAQTERALAVQQELTRAISRPDGVRHVLALLAEATWGRAGLVDGTGSPLSPARFRLPDAGRRALATLGSGRGAVTETDTQGTTVVQPVATDAFLVLTTTRPPDGLARALLVSTVALLTVDADRRRAALDADLRLRDCAARLVLNGATEAGRSVAALTAVELPSRLRVLRLRGLPEDARRRWARLAPSVLTTDEDPVAALVPAATELPGVPSVSGAAPRVGVGPEVALDETALSATAAAAALDAASGAAPVVFWEERVRSGVLGALSTPAAQALADHVLGPLRAEPELLATLECYLRLLGRWQPTADELGIHRNTLRKRMARIAALTGRDPDSAGGRADLWIAVSTPGSPCGS